MPENARAIYVRDNTLPTIGKFSKFSCVFSFLFLTLDSPTSRNDYDCFHEEIYLKFRSTFSKDVTIFFILDV